jgi:transcriptional regulator with XRE-family HTH domain
VSDNELGLFLRARREALRPSEAGIPAGPRRRTPGLRRAEVAMLAGISIEYLTRLEQGRDRNPSAQVLSALAGTLRLSVMERVHLYRLAKGAGGGFSCQGDIPHVREVRAGLARVVDLLEPAPAVLVNGVSDVLACTSGYERLMRPAGLLGNGPPANLARWLFTDPRARAAFPDWDLVANEQVALLKQGPFRADQHIAALADELTVTAGEEFAARAATVPGLPAASGLLRYAHPGAGELRLSYESLALPADGQWLVVYVAADEPTLAALDRLCRPGPRALSLLPGRGSLLPGRGSLVTG